MKPSRSKSPTVSEEFQNAIIVDLTPIDHLAPPAEVIKICWNTGEQKNCPACYLREGCKASG